jgi:hypothetical protein
MQRIIVAAATILAITGCSGGTQTPERVKEEVRGLIPEAASSPKEDWVPVSAEDAHDWKETFEKVHSFPLSRAVMLHVFNKVRLDDMKPDFMIDRDQRGDWLMQQVLVTGRKTFDKGYGTLIPPDSITDLTSELKDGHATGVVSFSVEGVYRGKVEYTAEQADSRWQIVAFRLPVTSWR